MNVHNKNSTCEIVSIAETALSMDNPASRAAENGPSQAPNAISSDAKPLLYLSCQCLSESNDPRAVIALMTAHALDAYGSKPIFWMEIEHHLQPLIKLSVLYYRTQHGDSPSLGEYRNLAMDLPAISYGLCLPSDPRPSGIGARHFAKQIKYMRS